MFFQGRDEVHKSMRRLVKRLEKAGIPYAIRGGMAVYAHQYRRTTDDLDILLTPAGFDEFKNRFVPKYYVNVEGRSRRFIDRLNEMTLDFLLTGLYPGLGKPGPFTFPDPEKVSQTIENYEVVNLPTLVDLKLAARRYQDFADVVNLIRANGLDESFQTRLHPSVRRDFIECREEKRREDEYEARQ